ncbi:hypothetical protein [Nonomuraea sp. NPDC046570]|uniref:hypothetical protein n=1 Tax=Nonomuraea sp. NPDC046570 TaxID=3155255 RepID=UPI0033E80B40
MGGRPAPPDEQGADGDGVLVAQGAPRLAAPGDARVRFSGRPSCRRAIWSRQVAIVRRDSALSRLAR